MFHLLAIYIIFGVLVCKPCTYNLLSTYTLIIKDQEMDTKLLSVRSLSKILVNDNIILKKNCITINYLERSSFSAGSQHRRQLFYIIFLLWQTCSWILFFFANVYYASLLNSLSLHRKRKCCRKSEKKNRKNHIQIELWILNVSNSWYCIRKMIFENLKMGSKSFFELVSTFNEFK